MVYLLLLCHHLAVRRDRDLLLSEMGCSGEYLRPCKALTTVKVGLGIHFLIQRQKMPSLFRLFGIVRSVFGSASGFSHFSLGYSKVNILDLFFCSRIYDVLFIYRFCLVTHQLWFTIYYYFCPKFISISILILQSCDQKLNFF